MSAVTASAAEFYAIVDNFAKKPRTAFMDVSVDTTIGAGIDVLFNVYDAQGVPLAEFTVAANALSIGSDVRKREETRELFEDLSLMRATIIADRRLCCG